MAIGVLVLGKPGTGKSYSMKNFNPDEVKIISVHKPILPFRGKYEVVKASTGREIIKEMKNTNKKNIVIDDFQYVLGLPMMKRVSEKGWDKFNEIQQPYADVLEAVSNLPDDVIVYLTSHTETDGDGNTKIKTIGNALDKYITIEGLFMIVLGTTVVNDKYYFATQNSGNDTLKSPEGMFPSKWIPNDLNYVGDKIRNYYYMDGAKSDEEMAAVDNAVSVADTDVKPERKPRAGRTQTTKTHDQVVAENQQKMLEHMDAVNEAVNEAFEGATEVDFDKYCEVADTVPAPELEPVPRRTREERVASNEVTLEKDTYFFRESDSNYLMKKKGEVVNLDGLKEITKEEFGAGVTAIAKGEEPTKRTRKVRTVDTEEPVEQTVEQTEQAVEQTEEPAAPTRRARRTRTS